MTPMPAWNGLSDSPGWQTPTLANSWANFGGSVATAAYRIDGPVVRLRGTVTNGTIGFTIFFLPVGLRPSATLQFAVPLGGGTVFGRVNVQSTGEVFLSVGSTNTAVSLDGITFIAEQ